MFFSALFASFLTLAVWVLCFYRAFIYVRDLTIRDELERNIMENRRREIREEMELEEVRLDERVKRRADDAIISG